MFNPWVSHCVEKLFLQAPPHNFKHLQCAQSRARLRFQKSVFPKRSLTEFRIARAVPYGTPKSLTEFLQSGFPAEIPGRKSLMEFLLTIPSRYGIDSETPIAIRIPYGIGNPPQNPCGKQLGRLPEPNLPSFLGDILPFPNSKKSDEVKAKPSSFPIDCSQWTTHAPSRAYLATSLLPRSPPSAKQNPIIAPAQKSHQPCTNECSS